MEQRFWKNDPRVETVLLPIRDGLTVSRVIAYAFLAQMEMKILQY
jgi:hypothetical protein